MFGSYLRMHCYCHQIVLFGGAVAAYTFAHTQAQYICESIMNNGKPPNYEHMLRNWINRNTTRNKTTTTTRTDNETNRKEKIKTWRGCKTGSIFIYTNTNALAAINKCIKCIYTYTYTATPRLQFTHLRNQSLLNKSKKEKKSSIWVFKSVMLTKNLKKSKN